MIGYKVKIRTRRGNFTDCFTGYLATYADATRYVAWLKAGKGNTKIVEYKKDKIKTYAKFANTMCGLKYLEEPKEPGSREKRIAEMMTPYIK